MIAVDGRDSEVQMRACSGCYLAVDCVYDARSCRLFRAALSLAMRLLACYILLGLLSTCVVASQADSRDAVVDRSWLSDLQGTLSPEQALSSQWTKYEGPLARGFTRSVTWVRLKLDPALVGPGSLPSDHRLVLRIIPSRLDEVTVWRVNRLADPPVRAGDKFSPEGAQQGLLNHAVVFDEATTPFEVLLRMETKGNHSIHVAALRWDDASGLLSRDSIMVMGYLVFTMMVILWALITYLQQPSGVLLLFVFHQVSALFAAITLLGVWRMYAPGDLGLWGNRLTSFAIPLSAFATVLFHARLLTDLGARTLDVRILTAAALFPALGIVLIASGFESIGLVLTHMTIAVGMIFTLFVVARLNLDHSSHWPNRRLTIIGAYVAMVALMAPQSLRVLGVLSPGAWSFGSYFFYGLFSVVLMTGLLILRAREVEQQRIRKDVMLNEARRESELQRARAIEQGDLVAMLTHELKTPLSVFALALGKSGQLPEIRKRAVRAVENMREVIDRCALTARVDEDAAHRSIFLQIEAVDLGDVMSQALSLQPQAERIDLRIGDALPICRTDRAILLAIIGNLVDNALKYSPVESSIRIEVLNSEVNSRSGCMLRVINEVVDGGAPDPAQVFEKYYRGARARHRSGSGLGLYLSKRLAERLAGELSIRGGEASEVCFELWVPLVAEPAMAA